MAKKAATILRDMTEETPETLQEETIHTVSAENKIKYLYIKISEAQKLAARSYIPTETKVRLLAKVPEYQRAIAALSKKS